VATLISLGSKPKDTKATDRKASTSLIRKYLYDILIARADLTRKRLIEVKEKLKVNMKEMGIAHK